MAWRITDEIAGSQPIDENSTVKKHTLGTVVRAEDPTYGSGEFIYLKGVANTAAKHWVTYNADDFSTTLLVANAIGPVAVAMSACVASEYGWYQIQGKALGVCLTGFTDNGAVFSTATSGTVDDTSVAGDLINIAKGASAVANVGSTPLYAEFEISRPFADDRHANT